MLTKSENGTRNYNVVITCFTMQTLHKVKMYKVNSAHWFLFAPPHCCDLNAAMEVVLHCVM